VPGDYIIESYLMDYSSITIPEKTETVGTWPFQKGVIYPEQKFAVWQAGGSNHNMTITANQLYSADQVTLYVFDLGLPSTWDELVNLKSVDDYSEYNYLLEPSFT